MSTRQHCELFDEALKYRGCQSRISRSRDVDGFDQFAWRARSNPAGAMPSACSLTWDPHPPRRPGQRQRVDACPYLETSRVWRRSRSDAFQLPSQTGGGFGRCCRSCVPRPRLVRRPTRRQTAHALERKAVSRPAHSAIQLGDRGGCGHRHGCLRPGVIRHRQSYRDAIASAPLPIDCQGPASSVREEARRTNVREARRIFNSSHGWPLPERSYTRPAATVEGARPDNFRS